MDAPDHRLGAPVQAGVYAALTQKAAAEVAPGELAGHAAAADSPRSALARIEAVVVGGLALSALALTCYNVFVRHWMPWLTLEFVDEVQVYLVVWAIFLALGAVTLADRHVKADLLVGLLPARVQRALTVLSDVLGLAFAGLLLYYGTAIAYQAWDFGDVSTTTLRFPLWIYIAALPAGAAVMGACYAYRLARRRR